MRVRIVRQLLLAGGVVLAASASASAQDFDLVISRGRVLDPESNLDAVRDIGIRGDRIAAISAGRLAGRDTIDARGLVVAPGFIDLHRHAHGPNSYRFQVKDGVTSSFELEIGTADVPAWYRMFGDRRLVNFGVAAGHISARMRVLGDSGFMLSTGRGKGPATDTQVAEIARVVDAGLREGAVAVGMGLAYTPDAAPREVLEVFQVAARHGASVHAHLGSGLSSLVELIDVAAASGASLHVAHVNSSAGSEIQAFLAAVRGARARKLDVTTELYPYTAGATLIQSALFDDFESWPDAAFERFQWAATGERLTRETFRKRRAEGGSVIAHGNREEVLRESIADPLPIIASDGGRNASDQPTHPRAAGTFARILGRYVREEKLLSLSQAIRRMTLEPARRLEVRVPEMRDRGRLRVGAFADVVVFDANRIIDKATFTDAAQFSEGVTSVLVNGTPVLRDAEFVAGAAPGRAIRASRVGQPAR